MKRREALTVGQIIDQAIAQTGNRDDYDRQRACYLWQEVVGPTVNRHTTRRWIDRDELHVCIISAPMKNELMYHRAFIAQKINDILGRNVISNIIIH